MNNVYADRMYVALGVSVACGIVGVRTTGLGNALVDIELGAESYLLADEELTESGRYHIEDVAVAYELFLNSAAMERTEVAILIDACGVVNERGDAQLVSQCLAYTDLRRVGIQDLNIVWFDVIIIVQGNRAENLATATAALRI